MQTIPNSTLYLCKNVDLDPNYNYTIDFDNITAQANYFDSKIATEFAINEGYSYVRDTQALKVQAKVDDLLGINYLFYNNGNKRYYAFITKKEYVSESCTKIDFKLDVLQSFMFNYEIDESFVEREHQDRWKENTDYEQHLLPIYNRESENVERGSDFIVEEETKLCNDNLNANSSWRNRYNYLNWLCVITNKPLELQDDYSYCNTESGALVKPIRPTSVNGLCTNTYTYYIPIVSVGQCYIKPTTTSSKSYSITNGSILRTLSTNAYVVSITLFKEPPFNINVVDNTTLSVNISNANYQVWLTSFDTNQTQAIFYLHNIPGNYTNSTPTLKYNFDSQILIERLNINNIKSIDLEPKLRTSEYTYLELGIGSQIKHNYNIEDFDDWEGYGYFEFMQTPPTNINGGMAIKPLNYTNEKDATLTINGTMTEIPALTSDKWADYIINNRNSMVTGFATNALSTLASIGIGVGTGGIGLAVAGTQALNFGTQIANQIASYKDLKNAPRRPSKTAVDTLLDELLFSMTITIRKYSLRPQFKNKIFEYFYHYGYKCNDFKKPNTRSRYYFNYIKTIGANIKTNIDADFRAEIANIFNNGITIWHYRNALTFKGINNYDYENVETNLLEV